MTMMRHVSHRRVPPDKAAVVFFLLVLVSTVEVRAVVPGFRGQFGCGGNEFVHNCSTCRVADADNILIDVPVHCYSRVPMTARCVQHCGACEGTPFACYRPPPQSAGGSVNVTIPSSAMSTICIKNCRSECPLMGAEVEGGFVEGAKPPQWGCPGSGQCVESCVECIGILDNGESFDQSYPHQMPSDWVFPTESYTDSSGEGGKELQWTCRTRDEMQDVLFDKCTKASNRFQQYMLMSQGYVGLCHVLSMFAASAIHVSKPGYKRIVLKGVAEMSPILLAFTGGTFAAIRGSMMLAGSGSQCRKPSGWRWSKVKDYEFTAAILEDPFMILVTTFALLFIGVFFIRRYFRYIQDGRDSKLKVTKGFLGGMQSLHRINFDQWASICRLSVETTTLKLLGVMVDTDADGFFSRNERNALCSALGIRGSQRRLLRKMVRREREVACLFGPSFGQSDGSEGEIDLMRRHRLRGKKERCAEGKVDAYLIDRWLYAIGYPPSVRVHLLTLAQTEEVALAFNITKSDAGVRVEGSRHGDGRRIHGRTGRAEVEESGSRGKEEMWDWSASRKARMAALITSAMIEETSHHRDTCSNVRLLGSGIVRWQHLFERASVGAGIITGDVLENSVTGFVDLTNASWATALMFLYTFVVILTGYTVAMWLTWKHTIDTLKIDSNLGVVLSVLSAGVVLSFVILMTMTTIAFGGDSRAFTLRIFADRCDAHEKTSQEGEGTALQPGSFCDAWYKCMQPSIKPVKSEDGGNNSTMGLWSTGDTGGRWRMASQSLGLTSNDSDRSVKLDGMDSDMIDASTHRTTVDESSIRDLEIVRYGFCYLFASNILDYEQEDGQSGDWQADPNEEDEFGEPKEFKSS